MNNNLNIEQQSLITMYMNQYNITNNHIEQLCLFLDDIRNNIFNIMIENHTHRGINSERGRGRNCKSICLINKEYAIKCAINYFICFLSCNCFLLTLILIFIK